MAKKAIGWSARASSIAVIPASPSTEASSVSSVMTVVVPPGAAYRINSSGP